MSRRAKKGTTSEQRIFVNMLRPRNPEVSLTIAREAEGGASPNLDQGLYSKDECKQMWAAVEEGKGQYPYAYDPIVAQLGKDRNALFGLPGQPKKNSKAPKDWPAKFGTWVPGMTLGDFRLMHCVDIHKDARVADGALVTVGNYEYVVGTTGDEGLAAPYLIDGSKTGNYAANIRVAKRLSYAEMTTESGEKVSKTDFNTVVGQINNKPMLLTTEDGRKIAFFSNQRITWGHLIQDGKALTPSQVRKLSDAKGVTFQPLKERWVGTAFDQKAFWSEVAREMKSADTKVTDKDGNTTTLLERYESRPARSEDKDRQMETKDSAWNNLSTVQTRDCPEATYCYGFRYAQLGQAVGKKFTDDGKTLMVFLVLGGCLTHGLTKTKWQVNAAIKAANPAPAKAAKPKQDKAAKTAKPQPQKKSKPKKSAKPKATVASAPTTETETDVVPDDAAADAALDMDDADLDEAVADTAVDTDGE